MTKRIACLVLSAYCLLPSAGCGYTVHSALPGNYRFVAVQPFTNQIDITTDVTDRSWPHSANSLSECPPFQT